MARIFTRELTERGIAACNTDADHLKRAELLTGRVVLRALDTPDQTDVQISYTFECGRCTGFTFAEAAAPAPFREAPFTPLKDGISRVTATYDMWVRLDRGDLEPADAIQSPDYKVEANMLMMLPLMHAVNSWTAKVRGFPKEY